MNTRQVGQEGSRRTTQVRNASQSMEATTKSVILSLSYIDVVCCDREHAARGRERGRGTKQAEVEARGHLKPRQLSPSLISPTPSKQINQDSVSIA